MVSLTEMAGYRGKSISIRLGVKVGHITREAERFGGQKARRDDESSGGGPLPVTEAVIEYRV